MEQHQEQKHLCKLCNKSFSSGKVLGGHMRCHRTQNPAKSSKKRKKNSMGSEIAGCYSLRENPKKSWKFSAPNGDNNGGNGENPPQENHCKLCGKGFDSSKALFGHMRHHSRRRKEPIRCKECNKEFETLKSLTSHMKSHSESAAKVVADGQSDGETLGLVRRKRSRRMRCKLGSNPPSSSSSDLIACFSFDGVIEPEVEELALCLLMLSRGVGNWGAEFNESMGRHFSAFEAKSSTPQTHFDSLSKKRSEVEYGEYDSDSVSEVKVKMEIPEVGSCYAEVEMGMPKLDDESEMGFCEEEELRGNGLKCLKSRGNKKAEFEGSVKACEEEEEEEDGEMGKEGHRQHQCGVCLKVFGSGQALGGHKRSHLLKPHLVELEEEDEEEEEEEDDDEFKTSWDGDDDDDGQQQLVGLISSN